MKRRKGIKWDYNGDGQYRRERVKGFWKRYWRRWQRRQFRPTPFGADAEQQQATGDDETRAAQTSR